METNGARKGYARWQKAVLIGCMIVALLGTLGVIGGMVKVSGTISDYGGNVGAPVFLAFFMMLFSVWLFAGSGALLVYIARMSSEIRESLAGRTGALVVGDAAEPQATAAIPS
ncbi:MAG TPA: hypothetical protein VIK15_08335 [Candidatus Anoxymicrobiaceae bacterium]|jgi:hypothetical protein